MILIFFSLVVYRPLKKIINGAKEYASGNLTHKIDVKSHDEMGYLASTLNYMSGELHKPGVAQPDCRNVRNAGKISENRSV